MIPVLIVLGSAAASAAGLFVGAAATAAAHEVVQESKDELNAINADMQKMTAGEKQITNGGNSGVCLL